MNTDSRIVISKAKIAARDTLEKAKMNYLLNPEGFAALAARQGILIEELQDVIDLYAAQQSGEIEFNFNRLFRILPLKSEQIKAGSLKMVFK